MSDGGTCWILSRDLTDKLWSEMFNLAEWIDCAAKSLPCEKKLEGHMFQILTFHQVFQAHGIMNVKKLFSITLYRHHYCLKSNSLYDSTDDSQFFCYYLLIGLILSVYIYSFKQFRKQTSGSLQQNKTWDNIIRRGENKGYLLCGWHLN